MTGKKQQSAKKQMRKNEKARNPNNWMGDWVDTVLPAVRDFVNKRMVQRVDKELAGLDVRNWRWGSDIDVKMAEGEFVITEWIAPAPAAAGDKIIFVDEKGQLLDGARFYTYRLRFDHLQQAARHAHQTGAEPNIGLYYMPKITIVDGDKGWEDRIEENDLRGKEISLKALDQLDAVRESFIDQYGERTDEGVYIGIRLFYNRDENLIQVVTHKRHALDVIENKDGEVDYIDQSHIEIDSLALDSDKSFINIRSAVERHVGEHVVWKRVVRPSENAYKRYGADLGEYLMSVAEEVYKRACEAAGAGNKVEFEYNLMTGGLEAFTYVANVQASEDPAVATLEVGEKVKQPIELTPADRAAILVVAGRIEPDLWFHTQPEFMRRFFATYGKGDITVSDEVLNKA